MYLSELSIRTTWLVTRTFGEPAKPLWLHNDDDDDDDDDMVKVTARPQMEHSLKNYT